MAGFVPTSIRHGESYFAASAAVPQYRGFYSKQLPPNQGPSSRKELLLFSQSTADLDLLPVIREAILQEPSSSSEEIAQKQTIWTQSIELVASSTSGSLSLEQAEMALAIAFGWRAWVKVTSPWARKYMKTELPHLDQLQQALEWSLQGPLQLSFQQLGQAILQDPEVYLKDPASSYTKALSVAPAPYSQDPTTFHTLIVEKPKALVCTYHCQGSCASECDNCWVAFDLRSQIQ